MARRRFRFPIGVLFVGLLLVGILFLLVPSRYTAGINYFFVKVTSPVLNLFPKKVRFREGMVLQEEYDKLITAYANSHAELLKLKGDYTKLSGLRQKIGKIEGRIVIAGIVRTTANGMRSELVIDKGSADHLRVGQYVLSTDESTVIGTVYEVVERMARVRLVTDPKHYIPVNILCQSTQSYLPGQLRGKDSETAKIPLVRRNKHDVRVGDIVYASPKQGFLSIELIVGTISERKPDDGEPLLWDISVKPMQNFSQLTDVAIVVMDPESNGLKKD